MKIAQIDPSLFTWPYDVHLAKGLESLGHQVVVFTRNPGRKLPPDEAHFLLQHFYPGFESKFMKKLPQKLYLGLKGLSHIESMFRLVGHLRRWKPDVIHFQWAPLAVVDIRFILALRSIAPVILTVHDSNPFNNNPKAALQRLGAIDIMKQFDQLIVHTETARARLESYSIDKARINIIPHGPLLNLDTVVRKRLDDGRVNLLLFGEIKPYKGADVLLHAIAKLPLPLRVITKLRIVGRPRMSMGPLFVLVNQLDIKQQVEFDLRFVPDEEIPNLFGQTDIQLFPYREIDASGVLMLAVPAGKPIVASNIGLFSEMLNDSHGALVTPDDPEALSQALGALIADSDRRTAAAEAVKALANSIPSWQDIARKTEALYRLAINAKISVK